MPGFQARGDTIPRRRAENRKTRAFAFAQLNPSAVLGVIQKDIEMGGGGILYRGSCSNVILRVCRCNLCFTSVRKKTEFLDKSSRTIDILPVFFEPKRSPRCNCPITHSYIHPTFPPGAVGYLSSWVATAMTETPRPASGRDSTRRGSASSE